MCPPPPQGMAARRPLPQNQCPPAQKTLPKPKPIRPNPDPETRLRAGPVLSTMAQSHKTGQPWRVWLLWSFAPSCSASDMLGRPCFAPSCAASTDALDTGASCFASVALGRLRAVRGAHHYCIPDRFGTVNIYSGDHEDQARWGDCRVCGAHL